MTSRILVATDLSDASAEAVRQADAHAKATSGSFAVCHVVPNLSSVHMLFPQLYAREAMDHPQLEQLAGDAVAKSVADLTGRAEADLELFIDEGTAYAEIARRAASWGATRLYVGGHGATGLSGVLLGSVAERVVRHAPCSVVVTRQVAPSGTVLVATDLSDPSQRAVEAAIEEARHRNARLVAVHALDLGLPLSAIGGPFGAVPVMPPADALRDMREAARAALAELVTRLGGKADVDVLDGAAAPAIARAVESYKAELLVIATHGRTGLARVALGSVAERLISSVEVPVLVVRLSRQVLQRPTPGHEEIGPPADFDEAGEALHLPRREALQGEIAGPERHLAIGRQERIGVAAQAGEDGVVQPRRLYEFELSRRVGVEAEEVKTARHVVAAVRADDVGVEVVVDGFSVGAAATEDAVQRDAREALGRRRRDARIAGEQRIVRLRQRRVPRVRAADVRADRAALAERVVVFREAKRVVITVVVGAGRVRVHRHGRPVGPPADHP
jgi:nucleotide-binding universal stress UspA family protein